jgi:Ca-activated chloride channel family protein
MNFESKLFLPVLISTLVGCASDHDVNREQDAGKRPSSASKSLIIQEQELKQERRADDLEESLAGQVAYDQTAIRTFATELASKQKNISKRSLEKSYIQTPMPSQLFAPKDIQPSYYQDTNREQYASLTQSAIKQVVSDPVSTFSIDVDTGSYTNIRRMLNQGSLPPIDAVRIEEMINYFDYAYETPDINQAPFSIQTELALSPWSKDHALLRVGLKGYEPIQEQRPASNLVFLLDVSGSMNSPDKLPLLKKSLLLLSKQLNSSDKVSIVVYAGASGVVLEPTAGNQTLQIEKALENLSVGGSTNGQAGIQLAYQLAQKSYDPSGINRVILATDGDFNVGTSDVDSLKKLIEKKREEGISLTTLGFGTGNYNDELMEQLADIGNGNYAYIDGLNEARKVLVEELSSTLMTIAKDVKIQVEFNPDMVKEYRLLGYENRALAREDFNNDKVDAGEIGAGHTVTALYELVLQGSEGQRVDPLRYQGEPSSTFKTKESASNELAFIKFRYKALNETKSKLISHPISMPKQITAFEHATEDFRFSATVAEFGEVLRQSKYISGLDYPTMIEHALNSKGSDPFGYRSEFIQLLRLASNL